MKPILLAAVFINTLLAAQIDCSSKVALLNNQILKSKISKHPNPLKLAYLNDRLDQLNSSCKDGFIDSNKLKDIEFNAKIKYEKQKLIQDEAKLEAAYKKLEMQKAKLDARAKALKEHKKVLEDY